jgi:thioredoxin 1
MNNFKEAVNSNKYLVVDFYATWCGPCKVVGPIIDELKAENQNADLEFMKVDVDEYPELAQEFLIKNIPTILFIKDGEVVDKKIGMISKDTIETQIKTITQ